MNLYFVSSNTNKYKEFESFLGIHDIKISFLRSSLLELQSDSLIEVGINKSLNAYSKFRKPVLIEDDGIFIDALNGFPGPYSSYAFASIGNKGILDLLGPSKNRTAYFRSIIVFYDGRELCIFNGLVNGTISTTIKKGGWGFDGIFIPNGSKKTYSELNELGKKIDHSHRAKSLLKFTKWFKNYSKL